MPALSAILSLTLVFTGVTLFYDKFWPSPVRDDFVRKHLISVFSRMDDMFGLEDIKATFSVLLVALGALALTALLSIFIGLKIYEYKLLFSGLNGVGWVFLVPMLLDIISVTMMIIFLAVIVAVSCWTILFSAYCFSRLFAMTFIEYATDTKTPPLTFCVMTVGIVVTVGKAYIDLIKAWT